jgi:hypothetical protein
MNLPHPWGEYARLQARSSRNSKIDSFSWGVEEEMNVFLQDPSDYTPADERRASRLRASVARRERFRARLRKVHEAELAPCPPNPIGQFEARESLALIGAAVTTAQWALILGVARGYEYTEISLSLAMSVGAARAQMCRLRQQFAHLRPAAY